MPATTPFDRVIRGTLVLPDRILANGWIATRGDIIAGIGEGPSPVATSVEDYGSKLIMPGLVDGHMHLDKTLFGLPWTHHAAAHAAAGRGVRYYGFYRITGQGVNTVTHGLFLCFICQSGQA